MLGYGLFLAKLAVSLGLLWYFAAKVDADLVAARLADLRPWTAALGCALLAAQTVVMARRWHSVLGLYGVRLGWAWVLRITFIGQFFNQALPSVVGGDAVRAWYVCKAGAPLPTAAGSLLLDRVCGAASLLLLVAAALPWSLARLGNHPIRYALPVVAGLGLAACALAVVLYGLPRPLLATKLGCRARLAAFLPSTSRVRPARAVALLGFSVATNLITPAATYLFARAAALPISLDLCLLIVPAVMLVTVVPITVGGWGLREGAMVTAFRLLGLPGDDAFLLSVVLGLGLALVSLPGGVFWLFAREPSRQPR